ncbi:replication initiator protein [Sigmofec virus UA08Rod_5658]|uniref:Replication initiator protein n=1 Tax=Sigmofec virus UA08Rod_5658 TaxID=2929434 RepID=A0A976N0Y2_9VIRU|nr:replication initiator protein [Sigmofec virus UA08Rod_5658]
MSCYHPIQAWDYSPDQFDLFSKRVISFSPPASLEDRDKMQRQGRVLQLPCRHCVGCRLAKSREWANRAVMEQLYHDESWFLTLTYDDEHLPPAFPVDPSTGEILSVHATLVKKDLQDFMKRLRKNSGQRIRYFSAGEYGSQTYRPHYHLLLFGLHLDDVQVINHNFAGQAYYISPFIEKCWSFGMHILGPVTWQSSAYVARYTMKKASSGYDKRYYEVAGIEPEFQTMSLKPAIGRQYYDDHPDLFDYDFFNVSTPQGGRKMFPPEYFKKLYALHHPVDAYVKSFYRSRDAEVKEHLKLLFTDKDYYDILKDEERKLFSKLSSLTRDDI